MRQADSTGHSCPRCESPKTEIVTTIHPDDPLYFCFRCSHAWRQVTPPSLPPVKPTLKPRFAIAVLAAATVIRPAGIRR